MFEAISEKGLENIKLAQLAKLLDSAKDRNKKNEKGDDEKKNNEKGKDKKKNADEILTEDIGKVWDTYPGIKNVEIAEDNMTAKFLYEEIYINKGVTKTKIDEFYKTLVETTKLTPEEEKNIRDEAKKSYDERKTAIDNAYKGKKEHATKVKELDDNNEKEIQNGIDIKIEEKIAEELKKEYYLKRNQDGSYVPEQYGVFINNGNSEDLSIRKPYDKTEENENKGEIKQYNIKYETDGYGRDVVTIIDKKGTEEKEYNFEFAKALFGEYAMEELNTKKEKDLETHKALIIERLQNSIYFKGVLGDILKQDRVDWNIENPVKIKSNNEVFVSGKKLKEELEVSKRVEEIIAIIRDSQTTDKKRLKTLENFKEEYGQWEDYTRQLFVDGFAKKKVVIKNKLQLAKAAEIETTINAIKEKTNIDVKEKKYTDLYYKFIINELKQPELIDFNKKKTVSKEEYNNSVVSGV